MLTLVVKRSHDMDSDGEMTPKVSRIEPLPTYEVTQVVADADTKQLENPTTSPLEPLFDMDILHDWPQNFPLDYVL